MEADCWTKHPEKKPVFNKEKEKEKEKGSKEWKKRKVRSSD
jgi:hypothetical protein